MREWNEIFLLMFIRGHSHLFSDLSWRMRTYYKWMATQGVGTDLDTLPHAALGVLIQLAESDSEGQARLRADAGSCWTATYDPKAMFGKSIDDPSPRHLST